MPRRPRRTRLKRGGLTPAERWALLYEPHVGMPWGESYPFADEAEARACWRRNRSELMLGSFSGHPPPLWIFEPESFDSPAGVTALNVDIDGLRRCANELQSLGSWHRHSGRKELAEQFAQRAEIVLSVIVDCGERVASATGELTKT